MRHASRSAFLVGFLVLATPSFAAATDASDALARNHFEAGRAYFERVRELFERYALAHEATCTLDGRWEIPVLVERVVAIAEGRTGDV